MLEENKKTTKIIDELEQKFEEARFDPYRREVFLETIGKQLENEGNVFDNLATYQRWYVYLVWPRLNGFDTDYGIKIISQYFFVALLLGFNVWEDILFFVENRGYLETDKVAIYNKIQKLILESTIFVSEKNKIIFSEIVKLFKDKIKKNINTADLKISLKNIILSEEMLALDRYFLFNKDLILENTLNLIKNISSINNEEVLLEINKVMRLNDQKAILKYKTLKESEQFVINKRIESIKKEQVKNEETKKAVEEPAKKIEKSVEKTVEPAQEIRIQPSSAPSYAEIKAKILQFFPKDQNGEIIDTEGVYEVLEKTAEKYGDPKIKELYYFDEEKGKFEWSV